MTIETPQEYAAYLKRWSKKKAIRHYGGMFWAAGKWMTQIDPKMIEKMVKAKVIEVRGQPRPMYDEQTFALMKSTGDRRPNRTIPGTEIVVL